MTKCNGKKVRRSESGELLYTHDDKWRPINALRLENLVFRQPARTIGGLNTGARRHNITAYHYQPFLLFTACSYVTALLSHHFPTPFVARMHTDKLVLQSSKKRNRAIYISELYTFELSLEKCGVRQRGGLMGAWYMIFEYRYGNRSGYVIIE